MLMGAFKYFRRTPEQIVEDYMTTDPEPMVALGRRHTKLVNDARVQGIDPNTVLLLIQVFGPLAIAIVEALIAWVKRRRGETPPAA